jgi:hypothetical protein
MMVNPEEYEKKLIEFEGHEPMTVGCATRWMLLLEALDLIAEEEEERGEEIDDELIVDKVRRHKAITNYIDARYSAGLADLVHENNL